MIFIEEDILRQEKGLIIHGCNAQGVMGSGLALQIREKYPQVYTAYKEIPTGESSMGSFQAVRISDDLYVGNCITQLYFGRENVRYANLAAIKRAVTSALFWCDIFKMPLHSPEIGCGLGGLTWNEVQSVYEEASEKFPHIDITIFRWKP